MDRYSVVRESEKLRERKYMYEDTERWVSCLT